MRGEKRVSGIGSGTRPGENIQGVFIDESASFSRESDLQFQQRLGVRSRIWPKSIEQAILPCSHGTRRSNS